MSYVADVTRENLTKQARAFHTKKRLGQHFLVNPEALAEIVETLRIKPGDKVLEIGPGIGFLTRCLSETGADVTAIELDKEAVVNLARLTLPGVSIVQGDFLDLDISTIGDTIKIVGNVPYQITTPIVARIFGELGQPKPWLHQVDRVVLTVQREVAERFVASPGSRDYSQITILVNYFAQSRIVKKVPRDDFFPSPRVDSAVVEFVPREKPLVELTDLKLFRQVIKAGFRARRKMLKNNLSFLHASLDDLNQAFIKAGIDGSARAEDLSLQQFASLSEALSEFDMRVRS
ncbi:MAG TPA: 16S rRNA (adenine(1518)-N(6)/adenine(1519)-N(6))-dimethyltransferase RsmA [Planktothrix sp.]